MRWFFGIALVAALVCGLGYAATQWTPLATSNETEGALLHEIGGFVSHTSLDGLAHPQA